MEKTQRIIQENIGDVPRSHKDKHDGYEYFRRRLIPDGSSKQCSVSVYEIPPGKSAYPYHYHTQTEEAFYIIKGSGTLKTPDGDRPVSAGDFLFFPAGEGGAHKLTNTSGSETLEYLDFRAGGEIDVSFYPDSEKIGVWGGGINQVYSVGRQTTYYDGE